MSNTADLRPELIPLIGTFNWVGNNWVGKV